MKGHQTFRFSVSIPAEEYLAYYKGTARWIQVTSSNGKRVRFPASALRPFVDELGVEGLFEMTVDENSKLIDLRRLDR
jgi:hypothetical protein